MCDLLLTPDNSTWNSPARSTEQASIATLILILQHFFELSILMRHLNIHLLLSIFMRHLNIHLLLSRICDYTRPSAVALLSKHLVINFCVSPVSKFHSAW
jgi:hypothetical protein